MRYSVARIFDVLDYIGISYLSGLAISVARTFELEESIRRAGMNVYPPVYAARVIIATAAVSLASLYLLLMLLLSPLSLIVKVVAGAALLVAPLLTFAVGLSYPSYRADERKRWVETELPLLSTYLTAMAIAGLDIISTLERVARLKIFKGVSREAAMIINQVRLLGKDPIDAIESNASNHPSSAYRDLMLGFSATTRVGGNVIGYLEMKSSDLFRQKMEELKIMGERISLYTELYIIIAVIASISLYMFFTMNALFARGAVGRETVFMVAYSFIVMPLVALILIYLIDRAQPRNPIRSLSPYSAVLTYGVPLSAATLLLFGVAFGGYKVLEGNLSVDAVKGANIAIVAGLIALVLPGIMEWERESSMRKGMGNALANFLRDLVEIRKMGLSPEKSIVVLSQRNYGPFTNILRKISTSLLLGMDLETAVASALRGYKNWTLLSTMRFLSDAIVLGGGSIETLDSLARYARSLADFEEELKRRLKIYMFMPYVGAILVSGSNIFMISYMAQTASINPQQAAIMMRNMGEIALYITLGANFNAWLMGLVAGKLSDGSVPAGFKHSALLVLVSLAITLYVLSGISF